MYGITHTCLGFRPMQSMHKFRIPLGMSLQYVNVLQCQACFLSDMISTCLDHIFN